MSTPHEVYDRKLLEFVENVPTDLESKETTTAIQNLKVFLECRPPEPKPEPEPEPVCEPQTRWEKVKAAVPAIWDNETTRVLIKAGGAFGGVALVVFSTVHRDHVVQREALQQANQRPS